MTELEPPDSCSICSTDDEQMAIKGYLGIIPVSFCDNCYGGIYNLIENIMKEEKELNDNFNGEY